MNAAPAPSDPSGSQRVEERFVMHGVPWHIYVSLRDSLDGESSKLRLTYLQGELELMSPSSEHEESKSLIGGLLEAWCIDQGIELFVRGSTTLREERAQRGLEADESYSVGERRTIPDLAIEVVYSSFRVDKLETYRGLGVPEVWIFRDGRIEVHLLGEDRYQLAERSGLFPALDLDLLARHVIPGTSLTAAVRDFRQALAERSSI
jgi:Uma2 family endonuclease